MTVRARRCARAVGRTECFGLRRVTGRSSTRRRQHLIVDDIGGRSEPGSCRDPRRGVVSRVDAAREVAHALIDEPIRRARRRPRTDPPGPATAHQLPGGIARRAISGDRRLHRAKRRAIGSQSHGPVEPQLAALEGSSDHQTPRTDREAPPAWQAHATAELVHPLVANHDHHPHPTDGFPTDHGHRS
jgi:hypothetical protein